MIVLSGNDNRVSVVDWNGKRAWTSGIRTPWSVVETYGTPIIMVTNSVDDLRNDMSGIYVITDKNSVVADVVHRGGYCMKCGFKEGLWRLRYLTF